MSNRPDDRPPVHRPVERPARPAPLYDPEFHSGRPGAAPTIRTVLPEDHQRIIANPFLALSGAWTCFSAVAFGGRHGIAVLVVLGIIGLPVTVLLLHYHCLDCGQTGWLFRWRSHVCDAILTRRRAGRPRRCPWPNPSSQLLIWFVVIVGAAVLLVASVLPFINGHGMR